MDKRKITAHIPLTLAMRMDEVVHKHLGIKRNAFITMAVAFMLTKVLPILTPKKRAQVLRDIEKSFEATMAEAKKSV